jgi:single-strand DNA-binding protein
MPVNTVALVGRLGADPETRNFDSGSQVSRFTLYQNERYTQNDQPQERRHRFQVEVWGGTSKYVAKYLHKGSLVAVQGTLVEDVWDDEEGQTRSRVIVKANRIENMMPKKADDQNVAENYGDDDEF